MQFRGLGLFNTDSSTGSAPPAHVFFSDPLQVALLITGCFVGLAALVCIGFYFASKCEEKARLSLLHEGTPLTRPA